MKLSQHLTVGFFYGLGVGSLAYMFTYIITTAINAMDPSTNIPVGALSLAAFGFGIFTALGHSAKEHAKGE